MLRAGKLTKHATSITHQVIPQGGFKGDVQQDKAYNLVSVSDWQVAPLDNWAQYHHKKQQQRKQRAADMGATASHDEAAPSMPKSPAQEEDDINDVVIAGSSKPAAEPPASHPQASWLGSVMVTLFLMALAALAAFVACEQLSDLRSGPCSEGGASLGGAQELAVLQYHVEQSQLQALERQLEIQDTNCLTVHKKLEAEVQHCKHRLEGRDELASRNTMTLREQVQAQQEDCRRRLQAAADSTQMRCDTKRVRVCVRARMCVHVYCARKCGNRTRPPSLS